MLKSLTVENYALIEKSLIQWHSGFSVITGETGAGKSILLDALGLVQGARADVKALRDADKKCVVEAEFDVNDYALQAFFEENELEYDDLCIIRREVLPNGKSRAFVNDSPAPLTVVKELTSRLIDIHSQHQTLLLNQSAFQLHIVDAVADTRNLLDQYRTDYSEYVRLKRELTALLKQSEEQNANRDYVEFQLKQLDEAAFREGEQEELEQQVELLSHTSELKNALTQAQWQLSEKEDSICSSLKEVSQSVASVSSIYKDLESVGERVDSCLIELKDLSREVESKLADVSVDPQQLEQMNARLDLLYSLEKKHRVANLSELLALKASFEKQMSEMDSSEERVEELNAKIKEQEAKVVLLAQQLTEMRKATAQPLQTEVESILHSLGMQNARMEVRIDPLDDFSALGMDSVQFFFSANKNASLQPISSVASGGELSRVMLALKAILARSEKLPTIILDEIDTGVSGDVADKMGRLMKSMGEFMQVISITHLPQIAGKGSVHYKVYKQDNESSTVSHIKELTMDERVREVAQMLSGSNLTDAALNNAKELLTN